MPVKGLLRTLALAAATVGCVSACVPAMVQLVSAASLVSRGINQPISRQELPSVNVNLVLDQIEGEPGLATKYAADSASFAHPSRYFPEFDLAQGRKMFPRVTEPRTGIDSGTNSASPEAVKLGSDPVPGTTDGGSPPGKPGSVGPDGTLPVEGRVEEASPSAIDFEGNQILAFYGKPGAKSMGILGEYSKEQIAPLLEGYAKLYDEANRDAGVVPAFYIIFGTCWPEGNIGKLNSKVVEEYIAFAAEKGWLVFLDHQIGKYGVEESIKSMFPYLKYPNVHLALDPEWRTLQPMKEIGSITAAELNAAQKLMQDYLISENLPGKRMLVVHQFKPKMILQRDAVRTDFDRILLVHTADGFGSPPLKRHAYAYNAQATNMPLKGFKLFLESKVVGAGWDKPLMTPSDVLLLEPTPMVIMYQ